MKEVKTGVMVGEIMNRKFISVPDNLSLRDCAKFMIKKRVGSLLVCKEDKLLGILTEKDIIWALVKKDSHALREIPVTAVMKRKVVTIKPSVDVVEALNKMRKKKVRRLPVVENGKVIGMLTWKDTLRIDPGLFQLISETFKIKETSKLIDKEKVNIAKKPGVCEECGEYSVLYQDGEMWICDTCFAKR